MTGNYSIRMITTVIAFTIFGKRKKGNKLFHFKEGNGHELSIIIMKTAMWTLVLDFASERYVPVQ